MSMARETKEAITVPDDTKDTETNRVNEKIIMEEDATKIWRDTYGSSFILGSSTNGILGTSKLGESARVVTLHSVVNPNNVFREHFRDTTFRDDSETTAVWGTPEGQAVFTAGQIISSKSIAYNDGNVTKATMMSVVSSGSIVDLVFNLSADGGSNWESVTDSTEHVFSASGIDLRFKMTASGDVVVSDVQVSYG